MRLEKLCIVVRDIRMEIMGSGILELKFFDEE